jgi:hypothetical protein
VFLTTFIERLYHTLSIFLVPSEIKSDKRTRHLHFAFILFHSFKELTVKVSYHQVRTQNFFLGGVEADPEAIHNLRSILKIML